MQHTDLHSTLLYQAACSKCKAMGNDKSGDNLAVYSDGHEYCYNCKYYYHPDKLSVLRSSQRNVVVKERPLHLPEDSCTNYSHKAINWCESYGIDKKDMLNNGFLYSEAGIPCKEHKAEDLLLMPLWDKEQNLLAYQARYFGSSLKIPKYTGRGKLDKVYHFLYQGRPCNDMSKSNTLVITEDLLSAIKVSKAGVLSMPLFGNNFLNRIDMLLKLTRKSTKPLLWLDPDMGIKSIKESNTARLRGFRVSTILSTGDPKEHTMKEIENYVYNIKPNTKT